jgi:hypothetical protein
MQAIPGPQWFTPQPGSSMQQAMPAHQVSQQPLFPPAPSIGTTLPTGVPLGPSTLPFPVNVVPPSSAEVTPTTLQDIAFTPGFLKTQIGKRIRVEFLMGTGSLVDRSGTLVGVGASYILIRPLLTDDLMLCDMYSIKFVTIFA